MNIRDYIAANKGSATHIAGSLGIPLSYLSQMASGERSFSPEKALAIERMTEGKVTRQELRPMDFWKIWPDLEAPKEAA